MGLIKKQFFCVLEERTLRIKHYTKNSNSKFIIKISIDSKPEESKSLRLKLKKIQWKKN